MNRGYHASHAPAVIPPMVKGTPAAARAGLEAAKLAAARHKMQLDDMEAVRAAYWNKVPANIKKIALRLAGMDVTRFDRNLSTFDAAERCALNRAAWQAAADLETLAKCATGGRVNDSGEMGMHTADGVAAL